MKKWIVVVWTIIILIGIAVYFQYDTKQQNNNALWDDYETIIMEIEGKEYTLIIADTSERRQQGLMHVRKPVEYDGMVFRFPDKQKQTFWNKNTLVDLVLIWIRDGEVIGKSKLPSTAKNKDIISIDSPEEVDTIVELIQ